MSSPSTSSLPSLPGPSTTSPSSAQGPSSPSPSPPTTPLSPIYRSPIRPLKSILRPPPPPPRSAFTSIAQNFLSLPSKLGLPASTPAPIAPGTPNPALAPAISLSIPSSSTTSSNSSSSSTAPTNPPSTKPLKRAHFRVPVLSVTYSISSSLPPCSPETSKARLQTEEAWRETLVGLREGEWSAERVEVVYKDSCRTREERVDEGILVALKQGLSSKPRHLDLSNIPISAHSAAALADVLALNLKLSKLVLDGCDLDEHSLKPLLHALLISATLPSLSLANNPRLKPPAFTLLTTYLSRARRLGALDLSGVPLVAASATILVGALGKVGDDDTREGGLKSPRGKGKGVRREEWEVARLLLSEPWEEEGEEDGEGLVTLRLDNCALKPSGLEILAHAIRPSTLHHLSLRSNRISASGAVALAVLMKDYPDSSFAPIAMPPIPPPPPPRPVPPRPNATASSTTSSPGGAKTYAAYVPKVKRIQQQQLAAARAGQPPPPVHHVPPLPPSLASTPSHSPRTSIVGLPPPPPPLRRSSPPLITSNADGGITTRHVGGAGGGLPSPALLSSVRGMDEIPRLGRLRTVDLKGNDIRGGVTYVAQVLKRNRTLRVLNLAENRIDEKGLTVLAEALKYNETLETLDLSGNPCCGPSLEGITSLRTAFTVNSSLKRLFLANTSLTSPAAICLAEFIPESASLLHLDLTRNSLDPAGIHALSAAMRTNLTLRCLDLSIPPNDEEAARCSREILRACVRNTERAGRGSDVLGRSEIVRTVKEEDARRMKTNGNGLGRGAKERLGVVRLKEEDVVEVAGEVCRGEREVSDEARKALTERVEEMIRAEGREERLKELLELMDGLALRSPRAAAGKARMNGNGNGEIVIPETSGSGPSTPVLPMFPPPLPAVHAHAHAPVHVLSPSFSITSGSDGDDTDDDEPLDVGVDPDAEELARDFKPDLTSSPVEERSRDWVVEEGEVFRRGHALLKEDDVDDVEDVSGEQLRKELLQREVERPPPRPVIIDGDVASPRSPAESRTLFSDGA